jgi:hypothetical protein
MALLHSTQLACENTGTTTKHAAAFQKVADEKQCVIISRAVGKWATGLIEEGYATKGYHIKSKSCDWGPMAGFICTDPRFTKLGNSSAALEGQRKANAKAFEHHSTEIEIFISFERFAWLIENKAMSLIDGDINTKTVLASSNDKSVTMKFVLRRTLFVPGSNKHLYQVFYHPDERVLYSALHSPLKQKNTVYPVTAFVDPLCPPDVRRTYKAAMSGDYDLWAVYPKASAFDLKGKDARPVEWSSRQVVRMEGQYSIKNFERIESAKHEHMGNITDRIIDIKDALNATMQHPGGMMVHHSDEAGRPLMREVDLNIIAFVPDDKNAYGIKTYDDLGKFIRIVICEYHVVLNPGWGLDQRLLRGGFSATAGGSWEV